MNDEQFRAIRGVLVTLVILLGLIHNRLRLPSVSAHYRPSERQPTSVGDAARTPGADRRGLAASSNREQLILFIP
jgi:hypothetical protein